MTLELAQALHDDRRRQLLAERDAYQHHRAVTASRREDRRDRGPRRRFTALLRRRRVVDPKIVRIRNSWLNPGEAAAFELAATADEIRVRAGTSLQPGRFAYIAIDERHASLIVAEPSGSITLASDATLLVLAVADLRELRTSIPQLAAAWPESESSAPASHPEPEPVREFDVDAA